MIRRLYSTSGIRLSRRNERFGEIAGVMETALGTRQQVENQ